MSLRPSYLLLAGAAASVTPAGTSSTAGAMSSIIGATSSAAFGTAGGISASFASALMLERAARSLCSVRSSSTSSDLRPSLSVRSFFNWALNSALVLNDLLPSSASEGAFLCRPEACLFMASRERFALATLSTSLDTRSASSASASSCVLPAAPDRSLREA